MPKFLFVSGTRPEFIKLSNILSSNDMKDYSVCCTGQHTDLIDFLEINVDVNLNINNKNLNELMSELASRLNDLYTFYNPKYVIVHGDTISSLVGAITAFHKGIKVIHIEAGLRSNDIYDPFPEEFNRKCIDSISSIMFVPSNLSYKNIEFERRGYENFQIYQSGNTIVDVCRKYSKFNIKLDKETTGIINCKKKFVPITIHRRENFGEKVRNIINAINELGNCNSDLQFCIFEHPNDIINKANAKELITSKNISFHKPLDYINFLNILKNSYFIITDSGGVLEEGSILGKRVFVVRDTTERIELISHGDKEKYGILCGTGKNKILDSVHAKRNIDKINTFKKHPYDCIYNTTPSEYIVNKLMEL